MEDTPVAGPSTSKNPANKTSVSKPIDESGTISFSDSEELSKQGYGHEEDDDDDENNSLSELEDALDPEGFDAPPGKVLKPLTPKALAAFKAAQERAGIVYISRIPPGMQPAKVRHLMSAYGEVGRVYLKQEDAKRAYLRKKYTSTKKAHFTEGWVEFADKKVARSVAAMLNAQPIGGKKGSRWHDDVWTMKYLPKFKWNMLTEQVAHEAALHAAKLRVELSQSRAEQKDYLKNVELARILEKRAERKRLAGKTQDEAVTTAPLASAPKRSSEDLPVRERPVKKSRRVAQPEGAQDDGRLADVLHGIF